MWEDNFDEPDEFGSYDKDNENFVNQQDVQPNIFEEKRAVCSELLRIQTFYNDAPESPTTPRSLRSVRELPQSNSVIEEE